MHGGIGGHLACASRMVNLSFYEHHIALNGALFLNV